MGLLYPNNSSAVPSLQVHIKNAFFPVILTFLLTDGTHVLFFYKSELQYVVGKVRELFGFLLQVIFQGNVFFSKQRLLFPNLDCIGFTFSEREIALCIQCPFMERAGRTSW